MKKFFCIFIAIVMLFSVSSVSTIAISNDIFIPYGSDNDDLTLGYGIYGPNSIDVIGQNIFILDTWGHAIKQYDLQGEFITAFPYPDELYAMDMELMDGMAFIMCDNEIIYSASLLDDEPKWEEVTEYSLLDVVCLVSDNNCVYARVVDGEDITVYCSSYLDSSSSFNIADSISTSSSVISSSAITVTKNGQSFSVPLKGESVGTFVYKSSGVNAYVLEKEALLGLGYVEVRFGKYVNGEIAATAILTPTSEYAFYVPYKYYCLSSDGIVYQMIPGDTGVNIKEVAWQSGERTMISDTMVQQNDIIEISLNTVENTVSVNGLVSANTALIIAKAMCTCTWTYDASTQKTPTTSNKKSPAQLGDSSGTKTGVPYCVGGMNGLDSSYISSPYPNQISFLTAITSNGMTAGNISSGAGTYISGTAGVDCSGFICQAYKISDKLSCVGLKNSSYTHTITWANATVGNILIWIATSSSDPADHTSMISDIIRSSSGQITKVTTYESTRNSSQERAQIKSYTFDNISNYTPYSVY